jgi:hypothetical protein
VDEITLADFSGEVRSGMFKESAVVIFVYYHPKGDDPMSIKHRVLKWRGWHSGELAVLSEVPLPELLIKSEWYGTFG